MNTSEHDKLMRFERQMIFPGMGLEGQRRLMTSRGVIVGVGGLGSGAAELLVRGGVGMLRLIDDDRVDLTNLHRQALYSESDARADMAKVTAAARRLGEINSDTVTEPIIARLDKHNIEQLTGDVDLIIDGTDNFSARFVINDFAIKSATPWRFAGVVSAEAQTMTIVPGRTACLRCVYDSPPPACVDPACRTAGVLGPAVAAIAAIESSEALKILAGKDDLVSPYLTKLDLWSNSIQRVDVVRACADTDCPCCKGRHYEFLD